MGSEVMALVVGPEPSADADIVWLGFVMDDDAWCFVGIKQWVKVYGVSIWCSVIELELWSAISSGAWQWVAG